MFRSGSISLLFLSLFIFSCSKPEKALVNNISNFEEYITGYTTGEISRFDEIAVTLTQASETKNGQLSGLFNLVPSVQGEARWVNARTIVFKPRNPLKSDQEYSVSFNLNTLVDVPEDKNVFTFQVTTLKQDMEIDVSGIEPISGNRDELQVSGRIATADNVSLSDIQKVLKASQSAESLLINWVQDGSQKRHQFQISGIRRNSEVSSVLIEWNGTPIGVDVQSSKTVDILAFGAFELLETQVRRDQNPRIELTFSDPLDPAQNLEGLVRLERNTPLNYIIAENKLTINLRTQRNTQEVLLINEAVKSASGKRLEVSHRREVRFFQPKPSVELLGKGVIMPRSNDLYLPFKAVSLGAVDVQVTRIFENNMGQFLQDQNLSGTNQWNIRRVGRPVYSGVIPLSSLGSVDPGSWNNYALDLSKLIEPEPGAMYMIEIGFRSHQAVYPCENTEITVSNSIEDRDWELSTEQENEYWNDYSSNNYSRNFRWRDRDNPCSVSYYTSDRRKSRNILASDLGIIAKKANNGELQIFVTDIKTAKPHAGVEITLFDFQQQEISSLRTNSDGKIIFQAERSPYYAVASYNDQRGYLRLDDGTSLSLSDFDVSGENVQKGVKGFLYGERGVWRPGDTLFVSLILEDKNEVLPDNHPVTFELRNPSGQVVDQQTYNASLNGFYVYRGSTNKQAPTGNWRLSAKVGGLTFNKTLKIETVKPNRLKVAVDFKEDAITGTTRKMEATLSSQWLHGASAKNLKADIEMSLTPVDLEFEAFKKFSFSDDAVSFTSQPEQIFDGKLDSNGKIEFDHQFAAIDEGPGKLRVNLNLRVFEPSGSFSVGRANTDYFPFKTLVGIKAPESKNNRYGSWLSRQQAHSFEIVSVDDKGNPVGLKELEYEVYQIRWRWWWERGSENLSSFFERRDVRKVVGGTITTKSDGKNELNIKLPEEEDGGRYLVRIKDPKGKHSASEVVYFSWWRGRTTGVSPARLTFSSDKESYKVDEEIELNIPSSKGSRILVSLETGSEVLSTRWVDGEEGETTVKFFADGKMSPTVYAHVMHIQPHGQEENDLPIRMYGVIPIKIEDPETKLQPKIVSENEFKPETKTTLTISEESGKAMTYTIAIVDDGLLDLTNFKTPQPHDVFYAREALGIKTWDMFEFITSGFSGNLTRILAVGGDGSEKKLDPLNEANRFKPMVRFEGPFYLKAGAVNQHTISIPNYVGSVRTMVIAGQEGAYGETEKTTPVRKPVMVLATLPRVLGPAETVKLPVSVFAMKESVKNVQVRLEASEIFEIQGDASATLTFAEPGDELLTFNLKTKSEIGVGKIKVEVKSGADVAYHEIEIAVRNPNTPFVDIKSEVLDVDENWAVSFDPQGMIGTNTAILEVSRIPPIDFGRRLQYLLRYPHGCIEQTTSSAFPQLFIGEVMSINDEEKARTQQNIEAGITRIGRFLTSSGGLAYWPGYDDPNSWGTTYAYHFLIEAQKKGYYISAGLMRRINNYQKNQARTWSKTEYRRSGLTQAYRLYTLALANTPELGAMNRFRERKDLSVQAKWRLAVAYVLIGQPEAASQVLDGATTTISDYKELSGSFGSSLRDQAMILETLALLGRNEDAALLARDISIQLSSEKWLNTQETAYSLIGISKFLDSENTSGEMKATFSLSNKPQGSIRSNAFVSQIPLSMDEYSQNSFELKNQSEGTLFARLILEGTPLIGDDVSSSNSLIQKVKFINLDGDAIDPKEIEQGTDFVAEVTIKNPGLRGNYEEMALTQIFPSGWEIRNTRMDGDSFKEPSSSFDYQDIRDDRVYTYFKLQSNKTNVYRVQLNASYLGEFYLPAVNTSAMYDETISARTPGMWVHVVESK